MKAVIYIQAIFLFCGFFLGMKDVAGAYVGVNIGTDTSNLPSPDEIVSVLKARQITHVRLFDADSHLLRALSNTSIEVMVSVTNAEVLRIGQSSAAAASWINSNVLAYVPSTNITSICVGSEVLTTIPHASPALVLAMNNLYKALVASNLNDQIRVSTPHSMDIIPRPFPPSTASFNASWNSTMFQILRFLKSTNSFYMLNAYPYYEYVQSNGIFPIEYALFKPLQPVKQIVDPNTLFHYSSMFDALVDAAYYSMSALNFSGVPVVVTETGWPSFGGPNEPDATSDNAETYVNNLIARASNDSGPPSQPKIPIPTYIYELFNEDRRPGPVSERNWGILYTNGSSVFDLSLSISDGLRSNSSSAFCVAKPGVGQSSLENGLNWACGAGGANCNAIQQGQICYSPNTLENHASYAYNDYYQRMRSSGATCDFDGSAMLTYVDPSHGSCVFSKGSLNSNTTGMFPSPALGPVGMMSMSSKTSVHFSIMLAAFIISVVI